MDRFILVVFVVLFFLRVLKTVFVYQNASMLQMILSAVWSDALKILSE